MCGQHRTPDCKDGGRPRCVSCRVEGHASWDWQCPVFIRKCEELDSRLTENYMLYFPTNEAWTHVSQPPRPVQQVYHTSTEAGRMDMGRKAGLPAIHVKFPASTAPGSQGNVRTTSAPEASQRHPLRGPMVWRRGQPRRWDNEADDDGLPPLSFN